VVADRKGQVWDPLLEPLADNGGNSCTHALRNASSAAYDPERTKPAPGSHAYACMVYDQRGAKRDGNCDIGAYEFGGLPDKVGVSCTVP
jgi:hypothetical protein